MKVIHKAQQKHCPGDILIADKGKPAHKTGVNHAVFLTLMAGLLVVCGGQSLAGRASHAVNSSHHGIALGETTLNGRLVSQRESAGSARSMTNSHGMVFVTIPSGTFLMGSPPDEPERNDNERLHKVTITRPFYLQATEVTQGQWAKVMGNNPSEFSSCGDDCPVETVSWKDSQEFVRKLNQIEQTDKYRLPTEAEWEYACRAETTTPFNTGRCISSDQANFSGRYPPPGCPKGTFRGKTIQVASFSPNPWGLYDMHGNVREWCQDWFGPYPAEDVRDPQGPPTGAYRSLRGGSWSSRARYISSAQRTANYPDFRRSDTGLRVARDF